MAPRDVHAAGAEHLGVVGDIGMGSSAPLPTLATMTLPGVTAWVEVPNLRDTFAEGGVELLEERAPDPRPKGAFALQTPREVRIPCLIFSPPGVEKQLKIFGDDFFVAAAPCLHHLVPPHLAIPWFHKPPKHNVAVPINKVEGRLGGANPVGGGVGVAHHPMRGVGKGFGAKGGFTRNEAGGA